jgi:hypothetical protein
MNARFESLLGVPCRGFGRNGNRGRNTDYGIAFLDSKAFKEVVGLLYIGNDVAARE